VECSRVELLSPFILRVEKSLIESCCIWMLLIVSYFDKIRINLHWCPVATNFPSEVMISIEDFKSVLKAVVVAMVERVKEAEERNQNSFVDRTNIYRCEDGRPICYCCLRVGHVAKYCWDRKYTYPHATHMDHKAPPESSLERDHVDLQSLGRDLDKLLKELEGIAQDLRLSRTAPFRAEDIGCTKEQKTGEQDEAACVEASSHTLTCGVQWPGGRHLVDADHLPICDVKDIGPGVTDFRDVT